MWKVILFMFIVFLASMLMVHAVFSTLDTLSKHYEEKRFKEKIGVVCVWALPVSIIAYLSPMFKEIVGML